MFAFAFPFDQCKRTVMVSSHLRFITLSRLQLFSIGSQLQSQQECIPGGCILPVYQLYPVVSQAHVSEGGEYPTIWVNNGITTPPHPCERNDCKKLPSRIFVGGR